MSVPREGLEVVERPVLSPPTAGLRPRSLAAVRNPVNVNTRSGEREHGFRRT